MNGKHENKKPIVLKISQPDYNISSGQRGVFVQGKRRLFIDSHMHIQSGRCAPLPLVWDKAPLQAGKMRRTFLEFRAWNVVIKGLGRLQKMRTDEIGNAVIKFADGVMPHVGQTLRRAEQMAKTSDPLKLMNLHSAPDSQFTPDKPVFSILVIMQMDLEFGHYAGYVGERIYQRALKVEGGGKYYRRIPLDDPSWDTMDINRRRYFYFSPSTAYIWGRIKDVHKGDEGVHFLKKDEVKLYEDWEEQKALTTLTMVRHPWRLLGMYHYEPRRYQKEKGPEAWVAPFDSVATTSREAAYLGFKMYTNLGYMPNDDKLPLLRRYYQKCADEDIPILNHCTPGGMYTHERRLYIDSKEGGTSRSSGSSYYTGLSYEEQSLADPSTWDIKSYKEAYSRRFVHPKAWRSVLCAHPNLRLCLAHFGGSDVWNTKGRALNSWDWVEELIKMMKTYPNLYVDVSYLPVGERPEAFEEVVRNHPHVCDRILYGTDWYMVEGDGWSYEKYIRQTLAAIGKIDKDFWHRFTVINPLRFYRIEERIDQLAAGLKYSACALTRSRYLGNDELDGVLKQIDRQTQRIRMTLRDVGRA